MQKFLSISFAKSCYSVRKIEITLGIFRLWKLEHVTFLLQEGRRGRRVRDRGGREGEGWGGGGGGRGGRIVARPELVFQKRQKMRTWFGNRCR